MADNTSDIKATVKGDTLILHIPLKGNDKNCSLFKQPCWPGWLNAHYKGRRLRFTGHIMAHPNKYNK